MKKRKGATNRKRKENQENQDNNKQKEIGHLLGFSTDEYKSSLMRHQELKCYYEEDKMNDKQIKPEPTETASPSNITGAIKKEIRPAADSAAEQNRFSDICDRSNTKRKNKHDKKPKSFVCECGFSTDFMSSLVRHKKCKIHEDKLKIRENGVQSPKSFNKQQTRNLPVIDEEIETNRNATHVKSEHSEQNPKKDGDKKPKKFKCDCGFSTNYNSSLIRHAKQCKRCHQGNEEHTEQRSLFVADEESPQRTLKNAKSHSHLSMRGHSHLTVIDEEIKPTAEIGAEQHRDIQKVDTPQRCKPNIDYSAAGTSSQAFDPFLHSTNHYAIAKNIFAPTGYNQKMTKSIQRHFGKQTSTSLSGESTIPIASTDKFNESFTSKRSNSFSSQDFFHKPSFVPLATSSPVPSMISFDFEFDIPVPRKEERKKKKEEERKHTSKHMNPATGLPTAFSMLTLNASRVDLAYGSSLSLPTLLQQTTSNSTFYSDAVSACAHIDSATSFAIYMNPEDDE